jgi:hypothetical protein
MSTEDIMKTRILPDYLPRDWPDYAPIPSPAEWAVAQEEERIAARVFEQMKTPRSQTTTPESIAAGNAHLAEAIKQGAAEVIRQIESKELLSADDFCAAVGVTRDWLSDALTDGRLFAITGPGGRSFYPAFYAEAGIERAAVERVTHVLSRLPPGSQYWFYSSIRTSLQATPLEALRAGRLNAVLKSAEMFAQDAPPRVPSIVDVLANDSEQSMLLPPHDPRDSFADSLNGVKPR